MVAKLLIANLNLISIIVFLVALAVIVWRDRENIERHSIVFVRRTEHGIDFIDRLAELWPRVWRWWATVGIVGGFAVMVWIFGLLLKQTLKLFLVADAAPPVGPVLPTVSTVTNPAQAGYLGLPFWHFMISLSVVLFVHEGMHGVMARVEGFNIRSVGLILLGIIPGAFVQPEGQRDFFEPEPEDASATDPWEEGHWLSRLRVLVAGPWANITLALLLGAVVYGAFTTAHGSPELRGVYEHEGMHVVRVVNNSPAEAAGMRPGMVITSIGGQPVRDTVQFQNATRNLSVGQQLQITTQGNGTFTVTTGTRPDRGNYTFKPAPVDHVLPLLERAMPGTITAYERYNNWLVAPDTRLELARWRWVGNHYPGLSDRADAQVQQLQTELAKQPAEGFVGIFVVPEQHVKQQFRGIVGPLMLFFQVLFFVAILNFMIGSANLLPIKGLDGGWMVSILLEEVRPAWERPVSHTTTLLTVGMIVISFGFLIVGAF